MSNIKENKIELKDKELQILFDYYKQQRDEMWQYDKVIVSLSFQLLVTTAGLVSASIIKKESLIFQAGAGIIIIIVGIIGICISIQLKNWSNFHKERTKMIRNKIKIIDDIVNATDENKPKLKLENTYYTIYGLVILIGLLFVITSVLNCFGYK